MRKRVLAHILVTLLIFLIFLLLTTVPILGSQTNGENLWRGEVKSIPLDGVTFCEYGVDKDEKI
jgi:hypothetical protein